MRTDCVRNVLSQLRPLLEGVPVAGDELAAMAVDVRQRAETVKLRLEDEVGMIEGL